MVFIIESNKLILKDANPQELHYLKVNYTLLKQQDKYFITGTPDKLFKTLLNLSYTYDIEIV